MDLSGDSTVEYYGSSMEYESDSSSEYPSSVMSSSPGGSDNSNSLSVDGSSVDGSSVDGSSVDGSVTEEVETGGDDGNYNNDSWKCTEEDYSADKLLDCDTFIPREVGGHPRNCIPPDSRPEENVCMFLRNLLLTLMSSLS